MPLTGRLRRRRQTSAATQCAATILLAVSLSAYCAAADAQSPSLMLRSVKAQQDAADSLDRRKHVTFQNLDQLQAPVWIAPPAIASVLTLRVQSLQTPFATKTHLQQVWMRIQSCHPYPTPACFRWQRPDNTSRRSRPSVSAPISKISLASRPQWIRVQPPCQCGSDALGCKRSLVHALFTAGCARQPSTAGTQLELEIAHRTRRLLHHRRRPAHAGRARDVEAVASISAAALTTKKTLRRGALHASTPS